MTWSCGITPETRLPLRVVASGWAGGSWGQVAAADYGTGSRFDGFWMKTAVPASFAPCRGIDGGCEGHDSRNGSECEDRRSRPGDWGEAGVGACRGGGMVEWRRDREGGDIGDAGKNWKPAKLTEHPRSTISQDGTLSGTRGEDHITLSPGPTDTAGRTHIAIAGGVESVGITCGMWRNRGAFLIS